MCPTSGTSMPMGLCSSTPSRHQPSTASSTTTTTSAPRRTRLAKSGAPTSVLKQFSGSRTPFGWRTKGRCVETWLFSSASSPPQCRNTLALCPGRKTPFLSSQVREEHLFSGNPTCSAMGMFAVMEGLVFGGSGSWRV
uniref:Uncharacterized protein n=1 Tax=Junco hyemalis TaxID=40217 RepID=A0A8C5J5W4_JUNHY